MVKFRSSHWPPTHHHINSVEVHSLESLFESFILIFFSEIGDKTQLLALVLAARFKKPMSVFCGIIVATILNHLFAASLGLYFSHWISDSYMRWIIGGAFLVFAAWILIPDKEVEEESKLNWGPFLTTTILFFVAEMGDKTQLATLALAAKYSDLILVTLGSTLGLVMSNILAVYLGHAFFKNVPLNLIRIVSSILFLISGLAVILMY